MTGRYVPPLLPGLYPQPRRGRVRRLLGWLRRVVVRSTRAWWAATKDDEMFRDDAWRNSAP